MTDSGPQAPDIREAIIQRDGRKCRYCGLSLDGSSPDKVPAIDHLRPRCKGGNDAPGNLVAACRSCNSRKGGRTPAEAGMNLLPEDRDGVPMMLWHAMQIAIETGVSEQVALAATRRMYRTTRHAVACEAVLHECRSYAARRLVQSITLNGSCLCSPRLLPDREYGLHLACNFDSQEGEEHGVFMEHEVQIVFTPITWGSQFPYDFEVLELEHKSELSVLISDSAPTAEATRHFGQRGKPLIWFSSGEVEREPVKCLRSILCCLESENLARSDAYRRGWEDRDETPEALLQASEPEAAE